MDDVFGGIIAIVIGLAIIAFVIYCIVLLASAIGAVAAGGGVLWGGGTAIVNYSKSFKENMIDSNRAVA